MNIVETIELVDLENPITKQYATVNGEPIINFFKRIKQQYQTDKPINLIADGAVYHWRELKIKEARILGIKLLFYHHIAPSFNPIEQR